MNGGWVMHDEHETDRVVVVGGGFAGVWAAINAAETARDADREVEVVVVSRDDHLTVRPRLYETDLTGARLPLGPVLEPRGIRLEVGEAVSVDTTDRHVLLESGRRVPYDVVVLAAGSALARGAAWATDPAVHTIDTERDAVLLQRHLGEHAGPVVVVGAGLAGVELAAELAARHDVSLVDASPDLGHHGDVGGHLADVLTDLGVTLVLGERVVDVGGGHVVTDGGRRIAVDTVVSTTGMRASTLAAGLGAPLDELGRVVVPATLAVPGAERVFVAGDVAHVEAAPGHVAPMSCQCAIPMGTVAGRNAVRALAGDVLETYEQPQYVTCIDLGAAGAAFTSGWQRELTVSGADAKAIKRLINHELIRPPLVDQAATIEPATIEPATIRRGA
jgi:NADH dehydrogenase